MEHLSFSTAEDRSNIPEVGVGVNSSNDNLLNLEDYASHVTYNVSYLNYSILINSHPDAGVSIDANHNIDINPSAGFNGFSDVTIEAKDQDGERVLDTFRVSVLNSYNFTDTGWYLISLTSQPKVSNTFTSVCL